MKKLVVLFVLLHIALGICPDGFQLVRNGECRGKYTTISNVYWGDAAATAVSKCKEIEAQPVIIHDLEDHKYWLSQEASWILIGVVCNANTKKWEWADGSTIDFKPPGGTNFDLNAACTSACSVELDANGSWSLSCSRNLWTIDFFCIKQMKQPSGEGCESFDDDTEDGVCYEVGAPAESWQDAQMICRSVGADLASIHNNQENSFVRRLAVSKGVVDGLFLGGIISGKGNNFAWIDGSPWDYQNFYPGFPHENYGECLAMDTSISTGQWMNFNCSAKLPVACSREKRIIPTAQLNCSTDTYQTSGVIFSPGYPSSASTPCDFFLSVDEGQRVQVELTLEANSCCDYLTLHDGYLGGTVIANITGSIPNATYTTTATNFMRVSWQPKGGVNVKGMMMAFHGV